MSQEDRARLMREDIQTESSNKVLPKIGGHGGNDYGDGKSNKKKYIIIGVVAGVVVLALVLGLTLGGGSNPDPKPPGPIPPSPGGNGYNPYNVESGTEVIDGSGQSVHGLIQADAEQVKRDFLQHKTDKRMRSLVQNLGAVLGDDADVGLVEPESILKGVNNALVTEIAFEIGQADWKTAFISLTDNKAKRYSPPEDLVAKKTASQTMRLDMCGLEYSLKDTFSFKFTSTRDGSTLVSSEGGNFLMLEKYVQLDLQLPSQRVYGLGERQREFNLEQGTWTMWANGQETPYDDGKGGKQTYGVHPFALVQTADPKEFMGIFFRDSNAQSPVLVFNDNGSSTLSYITTGASLEIYFFFKGTAKQIIAQYQSMVGLPALPPFWALGWHSSSYGYSNMTLLQENIQGYADAKIPLEGVWLDIPYMDGFADFSVNETAFPGLAEYTNELKKQNKRMIVIVDAGISADDPDNKYFTDALSKNALIRSSIDVSEETFGGVLVSHVWPNKTVFLDFFSDDAADIWNQGLKDLYEKVPYDGLWLDMNEATSFCNGECPQWTAPNDTTSTKRRLTEELSNVNPNFEKHATEGPVSIKRSAAKFMVVDDDEDQGFTNHTWYMSAKSQEDNSTYFLPFIPGRVNLDNMTMSLNATHPSNNMTEYDVHSLFGHLEAKRTREFLLNESMSANPKNRTFTLSRSTFAGSGQYTQHWLGDNHRTWDDMRWSIAGVMNFNMFGIPMVGPDTCGFFSEGLPEEQELCARWIQLATFYPFARQHKDASGGGHDIEPWRLPEALQTWAKDAINDRYQYLRHMYTCLFEASKYGRTCFDPLLFHFPEDDEVYKNIEHTFLVGDALKVSPVLTSSNDTFKSYFPAGGDWVSMQNYSDIVKLDDPTKGQYVDLDATLKTVNVHLRPGHIIPKQTNQDGEFNSTEDMMLHAPLSLIVNRDTQGHATGKLFLDDGYTLEQLEAQTYEHYDFQLGGKTLKKWLGNPDTIVDNGKGLDSIVITNAEDLNTTGFACITSMTDRSLTAMTTEYNTVSKTLTLTAEQGTINLFNMRDMHFGDPAKDLNLCDPSSHFYRFDESTHPSIFDSNKTSVIMKSQTPGVMRDLNVTLSLLASGVVNVHWTYANMTGVDKLPFEVPTSIVNPDKEILCETKNLSAFIETSEGPSGPGQLLIKNEDDVVVFSFNGMILDKYLNYMSVTVNTDKDFRTGVLGLTERVSGDLFLGDGVYSLWARDQPDPVETGKSPGNNMYGIHPFYMGKAPVSPTTGKSTGWFGVFANNAAAQDWWIKNNYDTGAVDVTTLATGGVGDLYIMTATSPEEVTKMYHGIVGTPVLTPQWALGWHQCRWGYNSTDDLKAVVANYSAAGIPLDTQWSDIDYMKDYRDFTYDKEGSFKGLGDFVNDLHDKDMHYIPIIDAGIAIRENTQQDGEQYEAYKDGIAEDIFIKDQEGKVLVGQVWAVDAAFPDFFNPKTSGWWSKWLTNFHNEIAFDGVWEDMNEASNFCAGACYASQEAASPVKNELPYVPSQRNLEAKSLPLDAVHMDNEDMGTKNVTELEAHSLFGTMEVQATHNWFKEQGNRTMIIERSAYAGMGKFASRWLGDNFSQEKYMGFSITGIMAHNLMGIQLVGSDICGFMGDTNAELCARWHVVGSFYPFSRNHNGWDTIAQEPYRFTDFYESATQYIDIMRMAIQNKYNLIRYYYTEMSYHSIEGGAFIKPLFYEFPEDPNSVFDQENNIMIGSALKLSVLSNQIGQNTTDFYFPAGTWCNIVNLADPCKSLEIGQNFTLSSKAYNFHLHLREGYMVPMQDSAKLNIMTSADLQKQPVEIHINAAANDTHFYALGRYLNDDGVVLNTTDNRNVYAMAYESAKDGSNNTVIFEKTTNATNYDNGQVNNNDALNVIIWHNAANIDLGQDMKVSIILNGEETALDDAVYDATTDTLTFTYPQTNGLYMDGFDVLVLTKAA